MKTTVKAYAKINLMLDILSKLENGYHNLFMLMQSVDIYDLVTVEITATKDIEIICNKKEIPFDERNIAHKAAVAFFEATGIKNCGIKITLDKNIPHAAGLAGGSADGAAVIAALNNLFETKLSEKQMVLIAAKVGADVPFCTVGGTMLAQYTGTVLSNLPSLKLPYIVIVKPKQSVSTVDAYKEFDKTERTRHLDTQGMLIAAAENDTKGIIKRVGNVFEQFIEVPDRAYIKGTMLKYNAECACMSGSGPSIFAIFNDKENAERCVCELKKEYEEVFLCSATDKGCEILN